MTRFSVKLKNILGLSYYRYELTSNKYEATIDTTDDITITCKVTDVFGNNINNKAVTLYHDGTSVSTQNTNSSGVATWNITLSTWGLHDFNVSNQHIQVNVDGWRTLNGSLETGTWALQRNKNNAKLILIGWSAGASNDYTTFGNGTYASVVRPRSIVRATTDKDTIDFWVNSSGTILYRNTGSTNNANLQMEWAIRDEDI